MKIESFGNCLSVFLCFWTILFEIGLSYQHVWIENGYQSGWEKKVSSIVFKVIGNIVFLFCFVSGQFTLNLKWG